MAVGQGSASQGGSIRRQVVATQVFRCFCLILLGSQMIVQARATEVSSTRRGQERQQVAVGSEGRQFNNIDKVSITARRRDFAKEKSGL